MKGHRTVRQITKIKYLSLLLGSMLLFACGSDFDSQSSTRSLSDDNSDDKTQTKNPIKNLLKKTVNSNLVKKQDEDGQYMERESEDGFLVVPDANGQVKDARQLFGTRMKVDGQTYADGFKTLQAFSKKDCESPNPKERYLGPWDKDLFFGDKAIKVWVDKNRNGTSDEGEISSLQESGIAAINTCYIAVSYTHLTLPTKA